MRYDIVIRGGAVFDGSGRPGERADVTVGGNERGPATRTRVSILTRER